MSADAQYLWVAACTLLSARPWDRGPVGSPLPLFSVPLGVGAAFPSPHPGQPPVGHVKDNEELFLPVPPTS